MTREKFYATVIIAVEIEEEDGHRFWETMKDSEVKGFIDAQKADGNYLSDIDYATKQEPEVKEVLNKAWELFSADPSKYGSYDKAIESILEPDEPEKPEKKVWTADEIKNLVQTNDTVLYRALKKLYAEQTADEKMSAETTHRNGAGFNSVDAKFLTSVAEFLLRTGFLTDKQKAATRKKLVKYTKQLTRIANA